MLARLVARALGRNHWLKTANSPQTISVNNLIRNGRRGLVVWKQCCYQRLSIGHFFSLWLDQHQPKTDNWPRSTDQHLQPTNPPATHHQQPSHTPKTDNRPSSSFTHQRPTTLHQQPSHRSKADNSGFDPRTSPVQVQQSPETITIRTVSFQIQNGILL